MKRKNQTLRKELENLKQSTDAWVKEFSTDVKLIPSLIGAIENLEDNSDHNYELIHELRGKVQRLNEEISALRMVQILHLKKSIIGGRNG